MDPSSTSAGSLKMSTPLSKKQRKRNIGPQSRVHIGPQSTPSVNKQEKEKCKPKLSRDSPAYNAFENLAAENKILKRQIRDLQKEVDLQKVKQHKIEKQMRQFFTKCYHCNERNKATHTLKYFFGLTNDFDTFVGAVCSFHCKDNLEEKHSDDKYSERLTSFEKCLVAKM